MWPLLGLESGEHGFPVTARSGLFLGDEPSLRKRQTGTEWDRVEGWRKLQGDCHRRFLYDHQSVVLDACFTNFGELWKSKEARKKISPVIIQPRSPFWNLSLRAFSSPLFLYVLKSYSPHYSILHNFVQHNKPFPQFVKNLTNVRGYILSHRFTSLLNQAHLSNEMVTTTSCHCIVSCNRWMYLYVDFFPGFYVTFLAWSSSWQMSSVRGQMVNTVEFVGHTVSVSTAVL